jgi:hypothetical protein
MLLTAVALSVSGLHAHHSLTGVYDMEQERRVEGVVSVFEFVNPHPFLTITVESGGGKTLPWRLEMDNRSELSQIGMTAETFKPGDQVTVIGSPGRTHPQSLYVRRVDRPRDKFRYEQVGSTPRINFIPR